MSRLSALLAVFLLLIGRGGTAGPELAQRSIEVLAEYAVSGNGVLDVLLQDHGFSPAMDAELWEEAPPIRKLEIAYRSAEGATRGSGDELLAALSADLARMYTSAAADPVLAEATRSASGAEDRVFAFSPFALEPDPSLLRLDDQRRQVIAALADYTEAGPVGSLQSVLETDFELARDVAYDLQANSARKDEVLARAYAAAERRTPGGGDAALAKLAKRVAAVYESARADKALMALLNGLDGAGPPPRGSGPPGGSGPRGPAPGDPFGSSPFVPGGGPTPSGPIAGGPTLGGTPERGGPSVHPARPPPTRTTIGPVAPSAGPRAGSSGNAVRYKSFHQTHYGAPAARGFRVMSRGVRGFGGVVFGNDVAAAKDIGPIRSLRYVPTSDGFGDIVVSFVDGTAEARFGPIAADHAVAAERMIHPTDDDVPYKDGDGIGLVGIADNTPFASCDVAARTISQGSYFSVVLHPALEGTELGWSAVVVDAQPIFPTKLITSIRESAGGQGAASRVERLFESMGHARGLGTWKVVDVPAVVSREGGRLAVQRADNTGAEFLARTAFLEMRPVTAGDVLRIGEGAEPAPTDGEEAVEGYDHVFAAQFYRFLPVITRGSFDYDNLNRFAAFLSVARLAERHGANIDFSAATASSEPTPESIRISDEGEIVAIAQFDKVDVLYESARTLAACRDEMEALSPSVAALAAEWDGLTIEEQALRRLLGSADDRYWVALTTTHDSFRDRIFAGDVLAGLTLAGLCCVGGGGAVGVAAVVSVALLWRRRRRSSRGTSP